MSSLLITGLLGLATNALATDYTWNAHLGLWKNTNFWTPTAPAGGPTVNDNVFITSPLRIEEITVDANAGANADANANANANANAITLSDAGFVPIADKIIVNNGVTFSLNGGGMVNDGNFSLNSSGSLTQLLFNGTGPGGIPQVIAGRGKITLSDSLQNLIATSNVVIQNGNGFGHTIEGAGRILNNSGGMINKETIRAKGTNRLIINPNGLGFVNDNGILSAAANSILRLESGSFTQINNASIRTEDATSLVEIAGAQILGGVISGFGTVNPSNSSFDAVTVNGATLQLQQANGITNTFTNGLTLNGVWDLNSTGGLAQLFFNGNQTLTGSGAEPFDPVPGGTQSERTWTRPSRPSRNPRHRPLRPIPPPPQPAMTRILAL